MGDCCWYAYEGCVLFVAVDFCHVYYGSSTDGKEYLWFLFCNFLFYFFHVFCDCSGGFCCCIDGDGLGFYFLLF